MRMARQRMAAGLYDRFGLDDEQRLENAFIGALGEVAFEAALIERDVPYRTEIHEELGVDAGDFFFEHPEIAGEADVDVKIAKTQRAWRPAWEFGIPVNQRPADKFGIVIGNWNPATDELTFVGSMRGADLRGRPMVRRNTHGTHYMTPNVELRYAELDETFPEIPGLAGDE